LEQCNSKGEEGLAKCPKCGASVPTPVRTWSFPSRKPLKRGEEPKLSGLFECPNCRARFRAIAEVEKPASIKDMVDKIRGIQGELMQTLKNLRDKIKTLETERANLLIDIDKLKKVADARVNALESEVSMLREDARSLRDLLGYSEKLEQ
jgi:transcription elongation factor Elf1